ncbi:pyridine nucleotide-disulfide oxidoreductase [Labrys sp. WJW]|uniref:NAD(P)/FAD-dependent oxidoreductase n=1 Tax=Labrys sp. WJW TaxID=1737983 RepID=UPI00082E1734|nr:FAD-dependent oxidoreductase [Labrys sp. WJW]OCC06242.1 pyridine nucleotide-disulfide oxidoreductase [Labrys sp. WJW]
MTVTDHSGAVVVVGAGQAGLSACVKLRELGHDGPITLIGSEAYPPYQRPPLSKGYLLGELSEERLSLRPITYYQQNGIDLRLSQEAVAIHADRHEVELSDGAVLVYSNLILATGSRPRPLPEGMGGKLAGVYSVRSIADIKTMGPEFQAGRRVLVVGGGYIGLEAAAVAAKLGLTVTLIESAPRILQRVASAQTAAFFQDLHRHHNVQILESAELATLTGERGRITAASLKDGREIPVDFAIVGIGVHPNVELARAAGIEIDNGIKVDSNCRTSDPSILAAGDCASFPWKGQRIRLESVGHAIDHGEAAARTIMNRSNGYNAKPWFWSDQFDVKLQIAGIGTGHDSLAVRKLSEKCMSLWYYKGADLLAVDAINQPGAYMVGKRLIEAGKSPDPALICDPETDLKALLCAV